VLNKLAAWLTVTLLPAVSTAVSWVQTNWPKISAVISHVWNGYILPVWMATINFVKDKLVPAVKAVVGYVVDHWPAIQNAIRIAWGQIKPLLQAFVDMIKTLWHDALQPIVNWVKDNWPTISRVLKVVGIAVGVALWSMVTSAKVAFKAIALLIKASNATWKTFGAPIVWAWNHVIKPIINTILNAIQAVEDATTTVIQGHGTYAPGGAPKNQPNPRTGDQHGHASGGIYTGGTTDERGPEIKRLPDGSMVYPAGQVPNGGGGGPSHVVIEFDFGGADSEFLAFMRKSIRVRGGNVQTVMGTSS